MFSSWEIFVEMNFLWPFVDEKNKPIPFWDKHFINYGKYFREKAVFRKVAEPQSSEEVNQFLERVTGTIVERGELISNYVKENNK